MKTTQLRTKKLSMSIMIFLLTIVSIMGASVICKVFLTKDNNVIDQQKMINIEHWIEYTALKNRLEQSLDFYKGLADLSNNDDKERLKQHIPELTVRGKNIFEDIQLLAKNDLAPTLPSDKPDEIKELLNKIYVLQNDILLLKPASKQDIFNYSYCVYKVNEYIDGLLVETEKLISNQNK